MTNFSQVLSATNQPRELSWKCFSSCKPSSQAAEQPSSRAAKQPAKQVQASQARKQPNEAPANWLSPMSISELYRAAAAVSRNARGALREVVQATGVFLIRLGRRD
ncbi:hypothetical protein E4U41_007435 [Claviceps citrina]|nr:hypothetical protein E4U41_007435 [Claviceps citrina]